MKLEKQRAVITGASHGLGNAIARRMAGEGAELVLIARRISELDEAAKSLRADFPETKIAFHAGDVTDAGRLHEIFEQTLAGGRIDILVNNAGVYGPIGLLEETSVDDWRYAFEVNFFGTLNPTRMLLPHFKKNKYGRIINISGGGATKGMPRFSCYAAAKAAVVRLTETIAMENGDLDIAVNAVAPGALNTRFLAEVLEAGPEKAGEGFYQASLKQKETGGSSLEHASGLCVFLASKECAGITGRLISAVWDDWENLPARRDLLAASDVYALRRITARDRGFDWDDGK